MTTDSILDSIATTATLAVGASTTGSIDFEADADWYRVTLTAGHVYRFTLQGAASANGTLPDPLLRLANAAGAQVAINDDAGVTLDSTIEFTATQGGDYYLSAQGFGSNAGTYLLAAIDLSAGPADVAGDVTTTSSLAVGASTTGSIATSLDADWFRITLAAGQQVRFDLTGAPSGQGTLADPLLRLADSAGVELARNDDSGGGAESSFVFTAAQTGTYYLSAEGYGSNTGTYTLAATLLAAAPGDVAAGTGTGASVTVGGAVGGSIDIAGDADWFAVTLAAGQQYRFDLRGAASGAGTLGDTTLRVMDGSGVELAFNDDTIGSLESSIVFDAAASGTYYLAAGAFGSGAGTYTLSATLLSGGPADIPGSSASSAQVLAGDAVTGTLEVAADADWYRVALVAGHQYRFDLQGQSANGGSLTDPTLRLFGPDGTTQLAFNDDTNGSLDSTIAWSATQSGTYFLAAEGFGSGTGSFTLRATETTGGAGDVPASTATSALVSMGAEVTGTVDAAGDQDWYRVTLVQGNHYEFRMQGSFAGQGTLADPLLRLLDINGVEVTRNDDSNGNRDSTIADYVATQSGTFLLSAEGFASNTGTYVLGATDLTAGPGDIAQDTGTAGSVPMGGTVAGSIATLGDADWFRVTLVAGHQYHFDLRGAGAGDGTLADATLRLLDASGAFIDSDDDSGAGFDSSLAYTATATGTYFLSAEGYADYSTGTYVLAAFDDYVDVAGGIDTAAQMSAGDTLTGLIDSNGDTDWLRITLTAGHRYAFDLQGLDSGGGDLADPLLRLLDADGALIALDDDSGIGLDAGITYTAAQSGDYFLAAQAYSAGSGSYSLRAFDFDAIADIPETSGTGAEIAVGGSVNGTIDSPFDADWYRVVLTAGRQYSFDLLGSPSGAGTLNDPRLRLFDFNGTEVAFNDDSNGGLESHVDYTATQSGTYYVSAEAFDDARGTYRLDVSQAVAAAAGTVPAAYDATGATTLLAETSGAIAVGGLVTGLVDAPADADLYRVALTAGHTYRFDLKGSFSGSGTLFDPFLRLFDSTGAFITSNDDTNGRDSSITYTATQTGGFFVSAQAFYSPGLAEYTGTYTLLATDTGAIDVPASAGTTAQVFMGAAAAGTLETAGDADWYRVTLTANHVYQFDLKGSPSGSGTLPDTVLRLLDANGNEITSNDDLVIGSNVESRIIYTASTSGTYLLAAQSFQSLYSGTYRLSAFDLVGGPADLPADTSTNGAVTPGGTTVGSLDGAGDADWYLVWLTPGHSYHFDLRGVPSGSGTLADPLLRLLDGAGNQVAINDDAGGSTESSIIYSPLQAGVYYVSAQAYNDLYAGTYALSVTDGLPDVAGGLGTSANLAMGKGTSGIIGDGTDTDWYRIELVAGHQYVFDMRGTSSGTGTLPDAYLELRDSAGILLAYNDDAHGGLDSAIGDLTPYEAQQSGVYYLVAASVNQHTGSYTLETMEVGAADMLSVIRTPGRISSAGGSAIGSIDHSGDQDWYRVNLVSGHQYRFDLQGSPSGNGTLADATLRLLSGTGADLAFNDDAGSPDSSITYTALSSGTYLLSAQGFRANTGSFTLRSTDLTGGDIDDSTTTGSDIAVGGRASGTLGDHPQGAPDHDWYRVSLVNGHTYRFDLRGNGSGAGTLADPFLVLLDGTGTLIDYDDDSAGGFESSITFTASSTADYYLSAQSFDDESTGTYVLDVTDLDGGSQPFTGSSFDDAYSGSAFNDVINGDPQAGPGGNDLIDGKAGDDVIDGGPGNDTLAGGLGNDTMRGGSGDDNFAQSSLESTGDDRLEGGDGNDSFSDWFGDNTLVGGAGDDRFSVYIADNTGVNIVTGGTGRDTYVVLPREVATGDLAYVVNDFDVGVGGDMLDIEALLAASANARFYTPGTSNLADFIRLQQSGGDTLLQWDRDGSQGAFGWVTLLALKNIEAAKIDAYNFAGSRDIGSKNPDNLQGASGNDTLVGAGGSDTLNGAAGADIMAGGSGPDTYYVDDAKDVVQETDNSLGDGALPGGLDLGSAIDSVIASISYTLTNFVENLTLAAGNTGLGGNGNNLDNQMIGNAGDNLLNSLDGNDTLTGQAGNDTLDGGVGNDSIDGGGNNDSLVGGLGFDTLIGGIGDDTLRGGDQADSMVAGDGNDFLSGGKGLDTLDGGEGNDTLAGLIGNDSLIGGNGTDTADYSASSDAVTVNLATGTGGSTIPIVGTGAGADALAGIENLLGSLFDDSLTGDLGNNAFTGNAGNDTMLASDGFDTLDGGDGNDSLSGMNQGDVINGGNGNDWLGGGKGQDSINGGADNDTLLGGLGIDTLTGGSGADTFVFTTAPDNTINFDTITDFVSGVDVIHLSAAIFGVFVPNLNTFVNLGTRPTNLLYNATTGALSYDADGAGGNPALNFAILGVGTHPASLGNDFFIVA